MTIPLFTLTGELRSLIGDDSTPVAGVVLTFTSNIRDGSLLPLDGASQLIKPKSVELDENGKINGDVGVDLLANDPSFNLAIRLQWTVSATFPRSSRGTGQRMLSWAFEAPAAGETLDLAEALPVVGATAQGMMRGEPGPSNELSIGTVTGGAAAGATITGDSPHQELNLVLPSGPMGWGTGAPGVGVPTDRPYLNTSTGDVYTYAGGVWSVAVDLTGPKGNTGDITGLLGPVLQFVVTIDHTKVTESLTDFPVFVDLSSMPAAFWGRVKAGGGDIRCFTADSKPLAREVVACDSMTKTGELHVKANLSSSVDTRIIITCDGVSPALVATDPLGRNAVWSNGFVVVSHDGGLSDSTANGFDGTVVGTIGGQANGKLGDTTQKFIGLGYVDLGNDPKLQLNNGTLSLWMQENVPLTGVAKNLISKSLAYGMNTQNTDLLVFNWGAPVGNNRDVGGANVADGDWHYATHTFQSGVANGSSIFLDGVDLLDFSMSVSAQTEKLTVGGAAPLDASEIADVFFDEVRVANTVRTPAWIAAEYANQSSPGGFYKVAMIGDPAAANANGSLIMTSPNGTKYQVTVADNGTITTVVAT